MEPKKLIVSELDPPLNYKLIKNNSQLDILQDFFNRKKEFVFDLETNIADSFVDRRIRTMSFGDREEQIIVDLAGFDSTKNLMTATGNYQASSDFNQVISVVKPALDGNEHIKIGYNLEFEYVTTKWCLGIECWNLYDCFLVEKIINCGKLPFKTKGFWALDDCIKRYLGLIIDKEEQKGFDLITELTDKQKIYAALDVRLPIAIKLFQEKEIRKNSFQQVVKIENDAIPAFSDMHMNGLKIDVNHWEGLIDSVEKEVIKDVEELDRVFIPLLGQKDNTIVDVDKLEKEWRECTEKVERAEKRKLFMKYRKIVKEEKKFNVQCLGEAKLNYTSPIQVKEALIAAGVPEKELTSTSDENLERLSYDFPYIKALQKYRSDMKLLKSYGKAMLEAKNPVTNRWHSDYRQIGAATGRPSSTDCNFFNIPKESRWRRGFIAEKGYKMITTDFSGQEARIAAELSQEPILLACFRNNADMHSFIAEMMFGQEWKDLAQPDCAYYVNKSKCKCIGHTEPFDKGTKNEKPSLRDKVKTINFMIFYGGREKKLATQLNISLKEAKPLLDQYYETLPILIVFLRQAGKRAVFNGFATTMTGRRRYFKKYEYKYAESLVLKDDPDLINNDFLLDKKTKNKLWALNAATEREGGNHVIQGLGTDMLKLALGCGYDSNNKAYLWHELRKHKAKLVCCPYDEIMVESPEEVAKEVGEIVKDCMVRSAKTFVKSIPFSADQHINDYWEK